MNAQPENQRVNIAPPFWSRPGVRLITVYLVVIAGAVVWICFGSGLIDHTRHPRARARALSIANAIQQFEAEYDFLPVSPEGHDLLTDTSAESGLIALLLGMEELLNPRRQNFLGDVNDAHQGLDGLIKSGRTTALVDSWGHPFRVLLDAGGDGFLKDPASGSRIRKRVLVWSAGKDGDFDTWEDNFTSWS